MIMTEVVDAVDGDAVDTDKKRKVESSTPPEGYICRLCSTAGHWIQVCPTKKTGAKRQRKSDHVPVPGQDPSPEDIERAKILQKIPPPNCFCGIPSRLNKVKRSKEGGDTSRALGKYFFFCSKKRDDETQCRFARPVETEEKSLKKNIRDDVIKKIRSNAVDSKTTTTTREDGKKIRRDDVKNIKEIGKEDKDKTVNKSKQVCKFFVKKGECKKGEKCEFSHEIQ